MNIYKCALCCKVVPCSPGKEKWETEGGQGVERCDLHEKHRRGETSWGKSPKRWCGIPIGNASKPSNAATLSMELKAEIESGMDKFWGWLWMCIILLWNVLFDSALNVCFRLKSFVMILIRFLQRSFTKRFGRPGTKEWRYPCKLSTDKRLAAYKY